jgi:hypothetical protein
MVTAVLGTVAASRVICIERHQEHGLTPTKFKQKPLVLFKAPAVFFIGLRVKVCNAAKLATLHLFMLNPPSHQCL